MQSKLKISLLLIIVSSCTFYVGGKSDVIYQNFRKVIPTKLEKRYESEYAEFEKLGGIITDKFKITSEYNASAGTASGHYFHQDLLVASMINKANPLRHIDIGSRIDGFVAHVASFRNIEVIDIRELPDSGYSNISFLKADLMENNINFHNISDSISILHAIEHFGLGRYGDPLNPNGHKIGFNNILKMLKPGGTLYISFPIAKTNKVFFNAHRVFKPTDIFSWADDKDSIELTRFDYVDDAGDLHQNFDITKADELDLNYGCGIYTFRKLR